MRGDVLSVVLCKNAYAFGILSLDRRYLGAADHGGRRKPRRSEIGDDDIVVPPAVRRTRDHQDPQESIGGIDRPSDNDECRSMLPHRTIGVWKWHFDQVP